MNEVNVGVENLRGLKGDFNFAGLHPPGIQRFLMESKMITHASDGSVVDEVVFRLRLTATPAAPREAGGDRYTCTGFTVRRGPEAEVTLPSLAGWSYLFKHRPGEVDELGQTLGIDHKPFEHLTDANGSELPEVIAYHVYNAFIDFHAFQVFTEPTGGGGGIQDLKRVRQKIVHAASHSRPSTSLAGSVAEGSYFENGEVTLELKGLSLVDERPCALVGFDSGQSSFVMLMTPAPGIEVKTVGSSHYWGDVYKDLETLWIRRANLTELVLTETAVPNAPQPVRSVVERSILVRKLEVEGS